MNNLKFYREKKGYTQEQLADELGITERAYRNYEADVREPKARLADRMAKVLNTSVKAIWRDAFPSR